MVLKAGEQFEGDLCIIESLKGSKKDGSNYCIAVGTDGEKQVKINIWVDIEPLIAGEVYTISGAIKEFQGSLNINMKTAPKINLNADKTQFVLKYLDEEQFRTKIGELNNLVNNIQNPILKQLVIDIFIDIGANDPQPQKRAIGGTAAKFHHHAGLGGWLAHTVEVATGAWYNSMYYEGTQVYVSRDLCIAGGLLHDIGKIAGYKQVGPSYDVTHLEKSLGHLVVGILVLEKYKTEENKEIVALLQHIIASHHTKPEWGAIKEPKTIEALCVAQADHMSSIVASVNEAYIANKELNNGQESIDSFKVGMLDRREIDNPYVIQQIMEGNKSVIKQMGENTFSFDFGLYKNQPQAPKWGSDNA